MRIAKRLGEVYNFETMVRTLYSYYEPVESRQTKQVRLQNLCRKPRETARDFALRVENLVSTCFSSMAKAEMEDMIVARFIHGHDVSVKAALLSRSFANIDEVVNHVNM